MVIIIVLLLLTSCVSQNKFPDTCEEVHGNPDLTTSTVVEYPCNTYQGDTFGNKR